MAPRVTRRAHLGLAIANYGPAVSPEAMIEAAVAAERTGWDSIWVTDHIAVAADHGATYGTITEAVATAAFLAGHTDRVQIGISALVVPQRHPLLTLKQLVSLDHLSQGRLITAVAAGWHAEEFRSLDADFRTRGHRLDAFITMAQTLAAPSVGPVTTTGLVTLDHQWFSPRPLAGRLRLWGAGSSARALSRAARLGTWHPVGLPLDALRSGAETVRQDNARATVILRCSVHMAAQPDPAGRDARGRPALVGPPDWVAQQLHDYMDAGCNGFVVMLEGETPGLADAIGRFTAEVWANVVGRP